MTEPLDTDADYSAAPMPAFEAIRALGRSLMDTFSDGWTRARPDLMLSVFGDHVTFIETPFSEPVTGRDAMQNWISDIPYQQSEPKFTTGEVFVVGPWFSTEFKLEFRRRKTGEWVEARGALFAETEDGKIVEMRMYWHRWNGGRETALP